MHGLRLYMVAQSQKEWTSWFFSHAESGQCYMHICKQIGICDREMSGNTGRKDETKKPRLVYKRWPITCVRDFVFYKPAPHHEV